MIDIKTQLAAKLAELEKKLAPPSGHHISLKGRIFTFSDGKTSPGPINAVILDWRHVNQFFKGVYNPQKVEGPSCFALSKELSGMKPSQNCADPQSQECYSCAFLNGDRHQVEAAARRAKRVFASPCVPPDATKDTPPRSI